MSESEELRRRSTFGISQAHPAMEGSRTLSPSAVFLPLLELLGDLEDKPSMLFTCAPSLLKARNATSRPQCLSPAAVVSHQCQKQLPLYPQHHLSRIREHVTPTR